MGVRKERSTIDAVATLVYVVQESWEEKKLAAALFIDIKGAFDHVSKEYLLTQMVELGIDGDLRTWTGSFLTDRKYNWLLMGMITKKEK